MAVYLITGASSGIGEAAARRLAGEPGAELVLVARREQRLHTLAQELPVPVTVVAADLTAADAPQRIAEAVTQLGHGLQLLVNNAGARFNGTFAEGGPDVAARTMAVNFDAPVRLTAALLPLLRSTAPSAIVNVSSTSAIIARPGAAAYSASKAALSAWTDALAHEQRPYGVHVGLVLPGFIATEGFPQAELVAKRATRWIVGDPEVVAEAIVAAGLHGRSEVYAPRGYRAAALTRHLAPGLLRRVLGSGAGTVMSPTTRST